MEKFNPARSNGSEKCIWTKKKWIFWENIFSLEVKKVSKIGADGNFIVCKNDLCVNVSGKKLI